MMLYYIWLGTACGLIGFIWGRYVGYRDAMRKKDPWND